MGQLHLEPFEVLPNYEREFYQFHELNNPEPIYINRIEIAMRPGSHHFILYTFGDRTPEIFKPVPNLDRDLRDESGNYILQNLLPNALSPILQEHSGLKWTTNYQKVLL